MICYRDMTFCAAVCGNEKCDRRLTDKVKDDAEQFGLPLMIGHLKTDDCGWCEPESGIGGEKT